MSYANTVTTNTAITSNAITIALNIGTYLINGNITFSNSTDVYGGEDGMQGVIL